MGDWTVTYYSGRGNTVISSHDIKDRNEHEAEKEAIADMPERCEDWSLVPKGFFS